MLSIMPILLSSLRSVTRVKGTERVIEELGQLIITQEEEIKKLKQKIKLIEQYIEVYEDYIKKGEY